MRLLVNGEAAKVDDRASVAALVATIGCGTKGVAVAVNEVLVPRSLWAEHRLRPGDRVEVLTAAQGG